MGTAQTCHCHRMFHAEGLLLLKLLFCTHATCLSIRRFGDKMLGAEVLGVDLRRKPPSTVLTAVLQEAARRGFLVFPNQTLDGNELFRASSFFGKVVGRHFVHPEAVHEDVLRLSNRKQHGIQNVGPQWHSDGAFERRVFSHVVFHAQRMPRHGGGTQFADLAAAYAALPTKLQQKWLQLVSVNAYSGATHPLVHRHPVTGRMVLFLHLAQTGAVIHWPNRSSNPMATQCHSHLEAMDVGVGPTVSRATGLWWLKSCGSFLRLLMMH